MSTRLESFEVVNTGSGVGVTFFATQSIKHPGELARFCLKDGDLIIHDNSKVLLRFVSAAQSRYLQAADEITLIGVQDDGQILIDVDCEYERMV